MSTFFAHWQFSFSSSNVYAVPFRFFSFVLCWHVTVIAGINYVFAKTNEINDNELKVKNLLRERSFLAVKSLIERNKNNKNINIFYVCF